MNVHKKEYTIHIHILALSLKRRQNTVLVSEKNKTKNTISVQLFSVTIEINNIGPWKDKSINFIRTTTRGNSLALLNICRWEPPGFAFALSF